MLKLLLAALLLVLVGLAFLGSTTLRSRPAIPTLVPVTTGAPPPTPGPGEVAVELTETMLTDQLNARFAGQSIGDTPLGPATLKQLRVQLESGQLLTTGDAQVGPTTLPIGLAGHLDLQAGRPIVVVQEARAAGVDLPARTRQALEHALQAQVDAALSRQPIRIRSLTIANGKLLLIGTRA